MYTSFKRDGETSNSRTVKKAAEIESVFVKYWRVVTKSAQVRPLMGVATSAVTQVET